MQNKLHESLGVFGDAEQYQYTNGEYKAFYSTWIDDPAQCVSDAKIYKGNQLVSELNQSLMLFDAKLWIEKEITKLASKRTFTTFTKVKLNKQLLTQRVFKKFTDVCGGNAMLFANELYNKFTVEGNYMADDYVFSNVVEYMENKVVPHKIEVYNAGISLLRNDELLGLLSVEEVELIKENLWLHDLSKFSEIEAYGYARHNFKSKEYDYLFERAWHHHKQNNPHHPEHWLNPNRAGVLELLDMPIIYVVEMVADWIGAGKTYGNELKDWLPKNLHTFTFHKGTMFTLQTILKFALNIETEIKDGKIYTI